MGQWGIGACLLVSGWVLKERNVSNQQGHKVFARFTWLHQFVRVCSRWEMFDRVSLFAKKNMMDRKRIWKKTQTTAEVILACFLSGTVILSLMQDALF